MCYMIIRWFKAMWIMCKNRFISSLQVKSIKIRSSRNTRAVQKILIKNQHTIVVRFWISLLRVNWLISHQLIINKMYGDLAKEGWPHQKDKRLSTYIHNQNFKISNNSLDPCLLLIEIVVLSNEEMLLMIAKVKQLQKDLQAE